MIARTLPPPDDLAEDLGPLVGQTAGLVDQTPDLDDLALRLTRLWAASAAVDRATVWSLAGSPPQITATAGRPTMDEVTPETSARSRLAEQVAARGELVLVRSADVRSAGRPPGLSAQLSETEPSLTAFVPIPPGRPAALLELVFAGGLEPGERLGWALRELETVLAGGVRLGPAGSASVPSNSESPTRTTFSPDGSEPASPAAVDLDATLLRLSERLEVRHVATTLACEASRLTTAGRVTVTVSHGPRQRLIAAAGQDRIDPRSEIVGPLTRLASAIAAGGEAVTIRPGVTELAPDVEAALDRYLEVVPASEIRILPLIAPVVAGADGQTRREAEASDHPTATPRTEQTCTERPRVVGTLIVESFGEPLAASADVTLTRLARVGGAALAAAVTHDRLPLLPLWRLAGRGIELVRGRYRRQASLIALAVLVLTILAATVPVDFDLAASGTLEPVIRRNVFAITPGTVREVAVRTGSVVVAGQPLVTLEDPAATLELERAVGELAATSERLRAVEIALLKKADLEADDRRDLTSQRTVLARQRAALAEQVALHRERVAGLVIVSPLSGEVQTWEADKRLAGRPVTAGQPLLTVADPSGPWQLELWLEEHRVGHLLAAWAPRETSANAEASLPVRFRLASDPHTTFTGTVTDIQPAAALHPEQGNAIRVTVGLDTATAERLVASRSGQVVAARIHVGTASVGYVWLHRGWEWIRTHVWM